jgi:hypothetical protein
MYNTAASRRGWRNGTRAGLRNLWRNPWRFKSSSPHKSAVSVILLASNGDDASKLCGEFGKNESRLLKKEKKEKMQKFG